MQRFLLTNAQVVTPTEHFTGSVYIEDGRISAIHKDRHYPEGIDLRGAWLIPGCIDIHSDYLEKELYPRPGSVFPLPFGLHYLDVRAAACGITTVFSAISFSDNVHKNRNFSEAIRMATQFDQLRPTLLLRHYLHARIDPNTHSVLDHLMEMNQLESLYMVVYNENIPGERQFSFNQQIEMRMKENGCTWEAARDQLLSKFQLAREINHRLPIQMAFEGKCILGSHDDTTVNHVIEAKDAGAVLSEMPTTLQAARKAKELGLWVCMGAPNYYKGGSHCGNLSCEEAMEEDLVDMLCSDYHFPTMLGSVVKMMEEGIHPSKAVNMVSLHPAQLLQFEQEVGSISIGKRADLVAFRTERAIASVSNVWVDGVERYAAHYGAKTVSLSKATGINYKRGTGA